VSVSFATYIIIENDFFGAFIYLRCVVVLATGTHTAQFATVNHILDTWVINNNVGEY